MLDVDIPDVMKVSRSNKQSDPSSIAKFLVNFEEITDRVDLRKR